MDDPSDNAKTSESPAESPGQSSPSPLGDAETLAQLRELLIGPEREELAELRETLASSRAQAQDIAELLPQAITLREQKDDQLGRALSGTVEEAIQTSVKNNPQPMIDAVFPVIGPAIRKAVSEALASAVQSLNQTLEHSLSIKSLKWRMEAARTGKPFAEVVLLNTLRYRVEQVFLIHTESGLLMQHVAADGVETRDEQLVSGMFTAITEFVRDSFNTDDQAGLRTMQVGGVTVWVERGPHAILAGAVRGSAPAELREVFQQVLEDIHLRHGELLETFAGDDSEMEVVEPELQRCLVSAAQPGAKRKVSPAFLIFVAVVLGLVLWAVLAGVLSNRQWAGYVYELERTRGIMLVEDDHNWWGRSEVRGLVSPDAAHLPDEILANSGIDPEEVSQRWEHYPTVQIQESPLPEPALDPEPPTLLEQAEQLLDPPASVTLRTEGSVLIAEGLAPHAWIERTLSLSAQLVTAGMTSFDDSGLVDRDMEDLEVFAGRIEACVIDMPSGSTLDLNGQEVMASQLLEDVSGAQAAADAIGMELKLIVTGHTDLSGDPQRNLELSQARAAAVAEMIRSRMQAPPIMVEVGMAADQPIVPDTMPLADQQRNRRVTFEVELAARP
ncbi:OmpA family protein [Algisphaera agarilytica]|uniref:OOP family OmpA-OmpF porin n=1 Tax=Algisphaera agarilytica TaxID=1385975 RepID=A0A7X0H4N0_9BACT|nr:OmpA family protein [Algisphaera agarilytica]MBB6429013.1 OOP family OmpA-OmpF porin [Algisphaera agarilytica]